MTTDQERGASSFDEGDNPQSADENTNQPPYLGDVVDMAVERMEEEGEPMSPHAEELLKKGKEAIHSVVEDPEQ